MRKTKMIMTMMLTAASVICMSACTVNGHTYFEKNQSATRFEEKMAEAINKRNKDKSFVFSPYSIKDCLTLTYDGMSRRARNELAAAGINEESIAEMKKLNAAVKDREDISIADKVFINDTESEKIDTSLIRKDSISGIDVSDPSGAAEKINSWVSDETHGHIGNVTDPKAIDEDTLMFLANAIWFKMQWQDTGYDSNPVLWKGGGKYYKGFEGSLSREDLKEDKKTYIFRLPYAWDEKDPFRPSMYVILPKKKDNRAADRWLKDCRDLGKAVDFSKNKGPDGYTSIDFTMPEYEASFSGSILDCLADSGIDEVYTDNRRGSHRTYTALQKDKEYGRKHPIYVSAIDHGAYIKTDRTGTEAAAYTMGSMRYGATLTPEEKPLRITCDHTFLYVIKDDASGQILFIGKVCSDSLSEDDMGY